MATFVACTVNWVTTANEITEIVDKKKVAKRIPENKVVLGDVDELTKRVVSLTDIDEVIGVRQLAKKDNLKKNVGTCMH